MRVLKNNILEKLSRGNLTMIKYQDWKVNRITPLFIDKNELKKYANNIDNPWFFHLGVGDGSVYRFFKDVSGSRAVSFADKIYIDPLFIIHDFLLAFESKDISGMMELSLLLRNSFLIPNSMNLITRNDERKIQEFTIKDFKIRKIKSRFIQSTSIYSTDIISSFNSLFYILSNNINLLIPDDISKWNREISKMGDNFICNKVKAEVIKFSLEKITSLKFNEKLFFKNINSSLNTYLYDWDILEFGDFSKINFNIANNGFYDIILASRSDSFLGSQYPAFLKTITSHISNNGIYISDGIVSSYDYKFFYKDLELIFSDLVKSNNVFVVVNKTSKYSIPPSFLSGIIISNLNNTLIPIVNDDFDVILCKTIKDLISIKQVKMQYAWTILISAIQIKNSMSLNNYIDVERISQRQFLSIIEKIAQNDDLFHIEKEKLLEIIVKKLDNYLKS